MVKITLKIDGMMCGMCEAHINDAIRSHFTVQRVSSSHKKGETIIYAADRSGPACIRPLRNGIHAQKRLL